MSALSVRALKTRMARARKPAIVGPAGLLFFTAALSLAKPTVVKNICIIFSTVILISVVRYPWTGCLAVVFWCAVLPLTQLVFLTLGFFSFWKIQIYAVGCGKKIFLFGIIRPPRSFICRIACQPAAAAQKTYFPN